jgi:hypothetical protein
MRWPKIHRSTVVVALLMLVPAVLMNVPGELISPLTGNVGGGYEAEYVHGWPWVSLHRSVFYDFSIEGGPVAPDKPIAGVPWLAWTSWWFWQGKTWRLWPWRLVGDVLVSLLLIAVVASLWEWRRRRRSRAIQFSLAGCLIAFTIIAAILGWWWHAKNVSGWEGSFEESTDGEWLNFQTGYYGPLWLRRLFGKDLLAPAFERVDSADLQVADDNQLMHAVSILKNFPYLRELSISTPRENPQIDYSELANLKRLRYLTLSSKLNDGNASEIAMLSQLLEIDISEWDMHDPVVIQRLLGALPGCRISENPIEYPANYDGNDRYTY